MLVLIQGDWVGVAFEYMPWRATGTFIMRALDDIQMLLDDQVRVGLEQHAPSDKRLQRSWGQRQT